MTGSMTGRVLNNRYAVAERVGLGGMAEVYKATDNILGRPVAVKVMLPQYAEDETFTKRFRQEAASAANLQSPYIVNIYDWGQDEGQYFIVMEFVHGSDLKTGISQRGAINQRKVAEIGSQVCQALSVAHRHDIIHRDIKPQNIMVQPDGNVKVMDFGIARAKNAGITQTSSVLGTAHYISPEQAQGKELGPASDIYSLGVVMYEAATGQLPFDGPDAVSVAMKQVSEAPIPPCDIKPDIDPTLEAIIMKAMAKDPANRFVDALDMRHALNDFLAGRPVMGLGDVDAFAGANTQIIDNGNLGPATKVMPVVGAGVHTSGPQRGQVTYTTGHTSYNEPEDDRRGGNGKIIGIIAAIVAVIAIAGAAAFFVFGGSGGVQVPDITNRTQEEAIAILEDAGFKVGNITQANSNTVAEGKVVSQDPVGGLHKEPGTKVNLVISAGVEQIIVPDLKGMTAEQAQAALSKLGLTAVAGKADYSEDVEKGKIASQSPAANTKASKGTTVEYCLSLGVESVPVPSVVGESRSSAINILQDAGFKVEEGKSEYTDNTPAGCVFKQSPGYGEKKEKGSTIYIYVSEGQKDVAVPNVVGSSVSGAKQALQAAGFTVSISGPSDSSAVVASQSPTGNAAPGSTVTITTKSSSSSSSSSSKQG